MVTTLQEYKVVWRPQNDVIHTVNLMIQPELVEKAKWDAEFEGTSARDELLRRVRNAAAVTDSKLRDPRILLTYAQLTITLCP